MQELKLNGKEHIRLCDLMSVMGLCETAGVAKNIIATGAVKVDGTVELRKRAKIVSGQMVEYAGEKVKVI